jgi:DNA-binding LacI/PurR family transcriptional regulator
MAYRMSDVAEHAGVSKATVSRVLNNRKFINPETRQRVLEVARQLKYYQNVHARRLAHGRSDLFGLIISEIANPFFPEVMRGFEEAALAKGFEVLLCNTEYGPERIDAAVRKMIENNVRGAAVMTSVMDGEHISELVSHDIATVLLDQERSERYLSSIRIDYAGAVSQAIDHLWKLGHRRFAFIAGPGNIRSAQNFRQAVLEAFENSRLELCRILEGNHKVDGGAAAALALLEEPGLPTAILCGNDLTAIGAMGALESAGVSVPRDVSVVGFDDIYFAHLARPALTTIRLSRGELGRLAFEALDKTLHSRRKLGALYTCETELVVRSSTGPLNPGNRNLRRARKQKHPQKLTEVAP